MQKGPIVTVQPEQCYNHQSLFTCCSCRQHAQNSTAWHGSAQHSVAQRGTAQHSTAQHSTAQHSTAQQSTAQDRQFFTMLLTDAWPVAPPPLIANLYILVQLSLSYLLNCALRNHQLPTEDLQPCCALYALTSHTLRQNHLEQHQSLGLLCHEQYLQSYECKCHKLAPTKPLESVSNFNCLRHPVLNGACAGAAVPRQRTLEPH